MTPRDGALVLSKHGWLSRMPADFRLALLGSCVWQRFEPGESVFVAGDPPGGIFGISYGTVGAALSFGPPDSPMSIIGHPGTWFGEGPIMSDQPRRVSAFAVTAALLANVPLPTLQVLLTGRPEWWRHIGLLGLATTDLVANCFADSMIRNSVQRCAAILLRLCDCRFSDSATDVSRQIMVKQDEFAAMANLSRPTANIILRKLAKRRLIELRYGSVVVVETKVLRKLANGE